MVSGEKSTVVWYCMTITLCMMFVCSHLPPALDTFEIFFVFPHICYAIPRLFICLFCINSIWGLLAFLNLWIMSFIQFWKFSSIISSKTYSSASSSPCGTLIIGLQLHIWKNLTLSHRILRLCSCYFQNFPFSLLQMEKISINLSSSSLFIPSVIFILLLGLCSDFLKSDIVFFSSRISFSFFLHLVFLSWEFLYFHIL